MADGWAITDTIEFEGHHIATGRAGPEAAAALVLVHGTPFNSAEWARLIPWLATRYRVHWFDLLGYGRSAMDGVPDVSLGIQNRVLCHLVSAWGLERFHVVAHDFGGATALRAHLLDRLDYASLTLIDPVAIRPWGSPFVAHVKEHEAAFAGMPAYMHDALLAAYLNTAIHRQLADVELEPYATPWREPVGQAAFYRQIAQMDQRHTDQVEPRLGEVRCPVQLLWGMEDQWIPIATGRRVAAMLPLTRFIEVPGAGHLKQEDAPEAIMAALSDFAPLVADAG